MQKILIICCFICFYGCESNIKGELKDLAEPEKLSIYGMVSPDSVWVQLGKSVNPYKNNKINDFSLTGGQIWLINDQNQVIQALSTKDNKNYYFRNAKLKVGNAYKIRASAKGFETVESSLVIIPDICTPDFTVLLPTYKQLNVQAVDLSLGFTDNAATKDYYLINYLRIYKGVVGEVLGGNLKNYEANKACYERGQLFTDECFNGKKKVELTYTFLAPLGTYNGKAIDEGIGTIWMRFGKVSKEYYELYPSGKDESGIVPGLSDPLPTKTNIKNGYGVVFAQSWQENYYFKVE
jgi:Domain of unknown function (DUF4249)